MVYKFSDPARYAGHDAQQVGEALHALAVQSEDDAPRVVRAARDAASPLHSIFEWNDAAAATTFRTQQARLLIRSVVRATPEEASAPQASVAVVRRCEAGEIEPPRRDDVPTARAVRDLQSWAARHAAHPSADAVKILADVPLDPAEVRAARLLRMWRARFADIPALTHVVAAVDEVLAEARVSA